MDLMDPANVEVIKEISLDDKIAFWNKVFDHADARGIDIIVFHWNIYVFGAKGKHGITDDMNNPKTIPYMRYCIGEFLKTYPQVDGIGITAGEHMRGQEDIVSLSKEQWLWQTYGQGVMDAKAADPDRELRIIFRQHQANLGKIVEAFREFDGPFNTGHKYARARLYSTTTSPYLDIEYRKRSGAEPGALLAEPAQRRPVRAALGRRRLRARVPAERAPRSDALRGRVLHGAGRFRVRPGVRQQGSGTVGPAGSRQALVPLHAVGTARLRPDADARLLRAASGAALSGSGRGTAVRHLGRRPRKSSPRSTGSSSASTISSSRPRVASTTGGFLSLDQFFEYPPLGGSGILSVQDYAKAVLADKPFDGITPMEVADRLDALAETSLAGVEKLAAAGETGKELAATLTDIRAMAHLGRYYADKIRGAAQLAVFRADSSKGEYKQRAIRHLTDAVQDWQAYAEVASSAYRPQLFSRTHYLDWWKILDDVKNEVEMVRNEKDAD